MSELMQATADEVWRRELANLSDYQLAERIVAEAGARGNILGLPSFELAGGTFHPIISEADTLSLEPNGVKTSLEDGDVIFSRGYGDRQAVARVMYAALWPDAEEAAAYNIRVSIRPEDQVGRTPMAEVAKHILDNSKTHDRLKGPDALYARKRTAEEVESGSYGSRLPIALDPGATQLSFHFTDLRPCFGRDKEALITLGGSMTTRPLADGYTRVEDNRILVSGSTPDVSISALPTKVKTSLPEHTQSLTVQDHRTVVVVSEYPHMNFDSTRKTFTVDHLDTDNPDAHRQVAAQLRWVDQTRQFFDRHQDQIQTLAPAFNKQPVIDSLIQAIDAARLNPDQPIEPIIVGARAVARYLAELFGQHESRRLMPIAR